jgi:LysM repeat protein
MATAIVVVLVVTAAGFAVARAIASPALATRTVSVQPGQSLWQLARAAAPGADVRDTVSSIRELNHLTGTTVTPGQVLVVPVGR